jgi:hypothetical protein
LSVEMLDSDVVMLGDLLSPPDPGHAAIQTGLGARYRRESPEGHDLFLDVFPGAGARCVFLRSATGPRSVRLALDGSWEVASCPGGGWLLKAGREGLPTYWLPTWPALRRLDSRGRILSEEAASANDVRIAPGEVALELRLPAGHHADCVLWQFSPRASGLVQALAAPAVLERQPYFLWGSHSTYGRPADLYRHLVHGLVYASDFAWPHRRRICSENDAHALYVIFSGLERATGSPLYALFRHQLLLSVLARQDADGGWRHGEWTDRMESHFRLVASACHLLMDALDERDDAGLRQALARAVEFLVGRRATVDGGPWFLHDELEQDPAALAEAPFRWVPSRALGKSPANMLVLNTHLDTTIALDRYAQVTGDRVHDPLVRSARQATAAVLGRRPAELLYRALFAALALTLLPTKRARRLPLARRLLKRLGWAVIAPNLHRVKARFPRLVMPGGFLERHLTLGSWASHYLTINVMDLARHERRFPHPEIRRVLAEAVAFTRASGILERWRELAYDRYALGFWAEALWHLCLLEDDPELRGALAEAVLVLEDEGMGLPPSVVGANAEAVPVPDQAPCLMPPDPVLRVVNLCRSGAREYLVVNPSRDARVWGAEPDPAIKDLAWLDAAGRPGAPGPVTIPARSWVRAITPGGGP